MLVLSRHINERVVITTASGERIEVCVVDIRDGRKVRLGFEADPSVVIHREEIAEAIEREQLASGAIRPQSGSAGANTRG